MVVLKKRSKFTLWTKEKSVFHIIETRLSERTSDSTWYGWGMAIVSSRGWTAECGFYCEILILWDMAQTGRNLDPFCRDLWHPQWGTPPSWARRPSQHYLGLHCMSFTPSSDEIQWQSFFFLDKYGHLLYASIMKNKEREVSPFSGISMELEVWN